MTCSGYAQGGTEGATVFLTEVAPPPPTMVITANGEATSASVSFNAPLTIAWQGANASCAISSNTTQLPATASAITGATGSFTIANFALSATYTLTCPIAGGPALVATVQVAVIDCPAPMTISNPEPYISACTWVLSCNGAPCHGPNGLPVKTPQDTCGSSTAPPLASNIPPNYKVMTSGFSGSYGFAPNNSNASCSLPTGVANNSTYYTGVMVLQFTNSSGQVIPFGTGTTGLPAAVIAIGGVTTWLSVPSGATSIYGSFTDDYYDDNLGGCSFDLTLAPLCAQ